MRAELFAEAEVVVVGETGRVVRSTVDALLGEALASLPLPVPMRYHTTPATTATATSTTPPKRGSDRQSRARSRIRSTTPGGRTVKSPRGTARGAGRVASLPG